MTEGDGAEAARRGYEKVRADYKRLVEEVKDILRIKLPGAGITPASLVGRAKEVDSFVEKIGRKNYKDPLADTPDLGGVRVVCAYTPELEAVGSAIEANFEVLERIDKATELGTDRMGYQGKAYIVVLGSNYAGGRYEGITKLKCEIQVRTILQDAWATIDHQLVYKKKETTPPQLRRGLNNVASLLEIAQSVFDSVSENRQSYLKEIQEKKEEPVSFLAQALDFDTVVAYTKWKFPTLEPSKKLTQILLIDIDLASYRTLADLDRVVERAKAAVEAYRQENPEWFLEGTDFITKSLGFVDAKFRAKHGFGTKTRAAFKKYEGLVS